MSLLIKLCVDVFIFHASHRNVNFKIFAPSIKIRITMTVKQTFLLFFKATGGCGPIRWRQLDAVPGTLPRRPIRWTCVENAGTTQPLDQWGSGVVVTSHRKPGPGSRTSPASVLRRSDTWAQSGRCWQREEDAHVRQNVEPKRTVGGHGARARARKRWRLEGRGVRR